MNISEATFAVVDTETTGLDPAKDRLVEVAAVATSLEGRILGMFATLVNPGREIPAEASGVHGITDRDVAEAQRIDEALGNLGQFAERFELFETYAAHTAEFDRPFLCFHDIIGAPHIPMLCTERLARHLWKGAPNYKNNTLRYWRGLNVETYGIAAHRALGDALVTAAVLRDELRCAIDRGIEDVGALLKLADSPIMFERWPFGKYRGDPISAAPADYISWCLREMKDLSRDMRFTLEQHLRQASAA